MDVMRLAIGLFAGCFAIFHIGAVQAGSGWTDHVSVDELKPTDLHYYLVRLGVNKNPSGCKDKQWFFQDYKTPGSDKMFLMLLEALKTGMRVRVYVTGRCNVHGHSEFSSVSVIGPATKGKKRAALEIIE
jgi:hypothetical protein